MTAPATNVEGRDFRRGSAFSVDKKTQTLEIFNHPIFVSSDVRSLSHFEWASDHMWFKC